MMKGRLFPVTASLMLTLGFAAVLSSALPPLSKGVPAYRQDLEQVVRGVVQSVETHRGEGLPAGVYLTLVTQHGNVVVQLSSAGGRGEIPRSVLAGDRVEITGCMVTLKGRQILLARQIARGSQVVTLRNKRGFPLLRRGGERPATVTRP